MGLLKKYGFYRPLPNDPMERQHIQPLSIAKSSLAGAGDTQVPDQMNNDSNSNPTPQPIKNVENSPNSSMAGLSEATPSNPTPSLESLSMGVSGAINGISDIVTNPINSVVSNIPQLITQTPTAKEQTKIQVAQQRALQQAPNYVQNNVSNGSTVGQGQSVDREEYFDDIIHDVGLSMFNRMQLG